MEKGFIKETGDLFNHILDYYEIGLLKRIFRKPNEFIIILEKYNIYD